ncbi:MAG: hypothetical protein JXA15_02510 [Spirochaetales bacterium]|nr:hypothetical protein [Spirochaetales bacterium]
MGFYAVRLSKDGNRLLLGMGTGLRISLAVAFLLALASLVLEGRWLGLPASGKLGSALVLVLLGAAAIYRDGILLDRAAAKVSLIRGLGPLASRKTRPLADLGAIELSWHGVRKPGFGDERRALVSLELGGRQVLLERSIPERKARALAAALAAFLPPPFKVRET